MLSDEFRELPQTLVYLPVTLQQETLLHVASRTEGNHIYCGRL